jgi:PhzF family phenazine biosynthesis protein
MNRHPFKQVDVFTSVPFRGNPVAVVMDAQSLGTQEMQTIARWTNLSETTFVVPTTQVGADYRVRIFTPLSELPFAGHPTLGTAHALLEAGVLRLREGSVVQECGVGLVRLTQTGPGRRLALEVPRATLSPFAGAQWPRLASAAGVTLKGTPQIVELGPRWLTCEVASIENLMAARPDFAALAALSVEFEITGVNLFARGAAETEVRSFAPACGVDEDPVCGSGNGAVAAFLRAQGEEGHYVARQGRCIGRDGYAYLEFINGGPILLGGDALTCLEGQLLFPA